VVASRRDAPDGPSRASSPAAIGALVGPVSSGSIIRAIVGEGTGSGPDVDVDDGMREAEHRESSVIVPAMEMMMASGTGAWSRLDETH
jgi:hypothetical protein